jgi:hypothetical protein
MVFEERNLGSLLVVARALRIGEEGADVGQGIDEIIGSYPVAVVGLFLESAIRLKNEGILFAKNPDQPL